MPIRLRKTDIIGLVGLAILLAWTPTYLAQDSAEEDLTFGKAFTLPLPRDGDKATLHMIVEEAGAEPRSFGPVIAFRFEKVDDPTQLGVPTDAVYREVIEHFPVRFETETVLYESEHVVRELYYADDGLLVWHSTSRTWYNGSTVEAVSKNGNAVGRCGALTMLNDYAGAGFTYVPGSGQATWADLSYAIQNGGKEAACDREGGAYFPHTLNRAATFGDDVLYGAHILRSDRVFDAWTADLSPKPHATCEYSTGRPVFGEDGYYGDPYFGSFDSYNLDLASRFTMKRPIQHSCDIRQEAERWDWLNPDFAHPVGLHRAFYDDKGDLALRAELVPVVMEKGAGEPLPVRLRPEEARYWTWAPSDRQHVSTASDAITVRDLARQPDTLAHGWTLPALIAAAAEGAPDDVRQRLEGATLYRFQWDAEGPKTTHAEAVPTSPSPIPLAPQPTPAPTENRSAHWDLYFLDRDDAAFTVTVTTTVIDGAREARYAHYDACVAFGFDESCDPRPEADQIRTRAILPPHVAIDATRNAVALLEPETHELSSYDYNAAFQTGEGDDSVHAAALRPPAAATWTIEKRCSDSLRACGWTTGSNDLRDGYPLQDGRSDGLGTPATPRGLSPFVTATTPDRVPVLQTPITAGFALGGLLLIGLSALVRVLAAIKSGAPFAFASALYAKIHKDDVLDHGRRDAIYELLSHDPGLTVSDIDQRLGYGWGTTAHHVETLRRNGLIASINKGRRRHHFPVGAVGRTEQVRAAYLRDPIYQAFLESVETQPGLTLQEITKRIKQSVYGASRTGKRLAAAGLVVKKRRGKSVRFYPAGAE